MDLKYPPRPPVILWCSYPCSSRATRALMGNDEYWDDVALSLGFGGPLPQDDCDYDGDGPPVELLSLSHSPCFVCGEYGPCGSDQEGRPWVHCTEDEDK